MLNFDEILLELSYKVESGVVDLTNKQHIDLLKNIIVETNDSISINDDTIEKAVIMFEYLLEIDKKKSKAVKSQAEKLKLVGKGGNAWGPKGSDKVTHIAKNGKLVKIDEPDKSDKKSKDTKQKKPNSKKLAAQDYKTDADIEQEKEKKKKQTQKTQLESKSSRKGFYKKGYRKPEGEEESGAAPGNAGSMLNENGSCDVCEWSFANDSIDLLESVKHLYKNLKGGLLLEADDKRGVGQKDATPVAGLSKTEVDQFREAGKGVFKNLSDGQLSRLMVAAMGGIIKANSIRRAIKVNGWNSQDCTVTGFFGDVSGKEQQKTMIRNANKIFSPDGTEIPKDVAIYLTHVGGGGKNPSDTAQFVYNEKTGDLIIKFTSDKDSFEAIVAQSSFAKEGQNKKQEIDDLTKKGKIKPAQAERIKTIIDKKTKILNKIESELKAVASLPAKKLAQKKIKGVIDVLKTLSGGQDPAAYYKAIVAKYKKPPFNAKTDTEAIKKFLKFASMTPEQQEKFAKDNESNVKFSSEEVSVIARLTKEYGMTNLISSAIDSIRKRSVAVERKMLDEMNKIRIPIGDGRVGLGDYMDAMNFIDKFHMGGAMGDKHGVFEYDGLFEVVCGKGVINNDIIRDCINTNNMEDFIQKFGSTKEEFQVSKENRITGSVRVAYFLNDEGKKIRMGEKRQRSKTGETGRFNTVYKWDKEIIECFKRKNKIK